MEPNSRAQTGLSVPRARPAGRYGPRVTGLVLQVGRLFLLRAIGGAKVIVLVSVGAESRMIDNPLLKRFPGVIGFPVTPFSADGVFDAAALKVNLQPMMESGSGGAGVLRQQRRVAVADARRIPPDRGCRGERGAGAERIDLRRGAIAARGRGAGARGPARRRRRDSADGSLYQRSQRARPRRVLPPGCGSRRDPGFALSNQVERRAAAFAARAARQGRQHLHGERRARRSLALPAGTAAFRRPVLLGRTAWPSRSCRATGSWA